MKFSEREYVVRVTGICYGVMNLILAVAYTVEFVKGLRSGPYLAIVYAATVLPTIAVYIIYKKNQESLVPKRIMAIVYGFFYLFIVFTSDANMTYVYAFPMFTAITLFGDATYSLKIGVMAILGNVIDMVIDISNGQFSMEQVEIRMAAMVLTTVYMFVMTIANNRVNKERVKVINEEKNVIDKMLDDTLAISSKLTTGIVETAEKMEILGTSVERMKSSMNEVNQGSTETAESMQLQLIRTEEIQNHIIHVKDAATNINEDMKIAKNIVDKGMKNVNTMAKELKKSEDANNTVLEKMEELNGYTNQMNSIIELISSVAHKTGLLALNASIEAARAGEAGRGFAVVAEQISDLASQTKSATDNISSLIGNINAELSDVSEAIDLVTGCNEAHAKIAKEVEESFEDISKETEQIGVQTQVMNESVADLEKANTFIVESIQNISAITEEMSAHSNETYNDCESNSELVDEVRDIVIMLDEEAKKLTFEN